MSTERLSLKKSGDVVLIGGKYNWEAFIVDEVNNEKVCGRWFMSNKKDCLDKGLPTKNVTKQWFKKQESIIQNEIEDRVSILHHIRACYIKL